MSLVLLSQSRNSEVWRTVSTAYFMPPPLMVLIHCFTSRAVGRKSLTGSLLVQYSLPEYWFELKQRNAPHFHVLNFFTSLSSALMAGW